VSGCFVYQPGVNKMLLASFYGLFWRFFSVFRGISDKSFSKITVNLISRTFRFDATAHSNNAHSPKYSHLAPFFASHEIRTLRFVHHIFRKNIFTQTALKTIPPVG
jgi:hypothetical protein